MGLLSGVPPWCGSKEARRVNPNQECPPTVPHQLGEGTFVTVIVGIVPHEASRAACAIDEHEQEVAQLSVCAGGKQLAQLLGWACPFPERTWAIESAGGLGYLLGQQLVAAGENVVDVPATLSSRVRLLGSGRSNKNDPNDARAVAVAALRAPTLAAVRREDHTTVLRLLAKTHLDLGRARSRACCRLHALAVELVAGGIRKEVVVSQAESLLAGIEPGTATQRQRLELASELLDEIRALDARLKCSKQRITSAVVASGTTLTDLYGVGPVIAAIVVGYSGDVCRFATAGHYASYNGTAPIELSSGGRTVHRLSRRGNRTLNHAIHMIAVTQIRNRDSEGRGYYDAKVAGGKTKREAMRALKRRVSDRVYRQLVADALPDPTTRYDSTPRRATGHDARAQDSHYNRPLTQRGFDLAHVAMSRCRTERQRRTTGAEPSFGDGQLPARGSGRLQVTSVRFGRRTQNSFPSGSASTVQDSSPVCPMSTRRAPRARIRLISASRSSGPTSPPGLRSR
jgi:transposase